MKTYAITDYDELPFEYVSEYLAKECRPGSCATDELVKLNVQQALACGWAIVHDGIAFDEREGENGELSAGGKGTAVLPLDNLTGESDFVFWYTPCSIMPQNGWEKS